MIPHNVSVVCSNESLLNDAHKCAQALGITVNEPSELSYQLSFSESGVALFQPLKSNKEVIRVDFCSGKEAHRRLYGGGKGQLIAKAVGVSSKNKPSIFDATAGLGKDAFVLASLGCTVTLMERSAVSYALLKDGLSRGKVYAQDNDPELYQILQRMTLLEGDSIEYLESQGSCVADVIYLDPMFPARQKKAAVKKDMQAFHEVVGQDLDNEMLFSSAQTKAIHRVAVKRSRHAPDISSVTPTYSLRGKSSRYDIYAFKSMSN